MAYLEVFIYINLHSLIHARTHARTHARKHIILNFLTIDNLIIIKNLKVFFKLNFCTNYTNALTTNYCK